MHSKLLIAGSAVLGLASAAALPTKTTSKRAGSFRPSKVRPRDPNATVNAPLAVTSINDNDGVGGGSNSFTAYSGDGTQAAGWPGMSEWVSFSDMFNNNKPNFYASCNQFNVPADTDDEINSLQAAIEQIAQQSLLDHRVILAIILNESTGCVRVPTTIAPDTSIFNPGLMQDYEGSHTCNFGASGNPVDPSETGVLSPCPSATIVGMVQDGAQGTNTGLGMASLVNHAMSGGASGAQAFYYAANFYNGGINSVTVGSPLSEYAQHMANRLVGWLNS